LIRIKRSRSQRVWGWDDIFAVAGWVRLLLTDFAFTFVFTPRLLSSTHKLE
jgi:hypothetical protein